MELLALLLSILALILAIVTWGRLDKLINTLIEMQKDAEIRRRREELHDRLNGRKTRR